MDGVAARVLKATSSFGAEFDSMADLVSFGVAPAILVFNLGLQYGGVELESGQFWGLLVAIPALSAFALFRNRIELLSAECALTSERLLSVLRPGQPEPVEAPLVTRPLRSYH